MVLTTLSDAPTALSLVVLRVIRNIAQPARPAAESRHVPTSPLIVVVRHATTVQAAQAAPKVRRPTSGRVPTGLPSTVTVGRSAVAVLPFPGAEASPAVPLAPTRSTTPAPATSARAALLVAADGAETAPATMGPVLPIPAGRPSAGARRT